MVIIHQTGTMDLAYNKSGIMGLSASNNMLKLADNRRGQVR